MSNANIPDSVIAAVHSAVESVLLHTGVTIIKNDYFTHDNSLFQWVETSANVETTVDMNFELAERLAKMKISADDNFCVAFRAHQ